MTKQQNCEYFQRCEVGKEDLCPPDIRSCDLRTDLYERLKAVEESLVEYEMQQEERIDIIRQRHRRLMNQRWGFGGR